MSIETGVSNRRIAEAVPRGAGAYSARAAGSGCSAQDGQRPR